VGIKDGKPFRYTGQVAADHFDHVHVACLGRFDATSYGPPWGGIQGTGTTATGVNLHGSPHIYGVAVDPRVIRLGSKLKITPNPFNYDGPFTAFDTGGAIKGNRIDFYDWRGRAAQNGWGHRNVSAASTTSANPNTPSSPRRSPT
jgi:3D (Asp-Asp-Asp) domain-containing protein